MFNDARRLLVDSGYDFVNSSANSQIQSIPFFAQTSVSIPVGTGKMKAVLSTVNDNVYIAITNANCRASRRSTNLYGAFAQTTPLVITDSTQGLEVTFTITNKGIKVFPSRGDDTVVGIFQVAYLVPLSEPSKGYF